MFAVVLSLAVAHVLQAQDTRDLPLNAQIGIEAACALLNAAESAPEEIEGLSASTPPSLYECLELFGIRAGARVQSHLQEQIPTISSDVTPQVVIDGDWKKVKNPTAAPYRGIAWIVVIWKGNELSFGTAFFVSPRVLVTSGHCLYNKSRGGKPEYVYVYPGAYEGSNAIEAPFGEAVAQSFKVPKAYQNEVGDHGNDIGWIILPKLNPNLKFPGTVFVPTVLPDRQLERIDLRIAGYPGIDDNDRSMWTDFETQDQAVLKSLILHNLDAEHGSSGSPLFAADGARYRVYGVHAMGLTAPKHYNEAMRFTKKYVDLTKSIIETNP